MLATAVNGLSVVYGESFGPLRPEDDGRPGWRIRIDHCLCVLPMKFKRESDAAMAMHCIANFTDWTLDERLLDSALHGRRDELKRLMTENLAW